MSIIEHAKYYENPLASAAHSHTSCELMYLAGGFFEIAAEGRTFPVYARDCVLIKSGRKHEIRLPANSAYMRYIAFINPWELNRQLARPELFAMLTDTSESGIIIIRDNPALQDKLEAMAQIFENGGNLYAELSAALDTLSVFYDEMKPPAEAASERSGTRLADSVCAYIEQHYAENIKIAQIAADHFISVGYLTHTFKTETGMPPREYLSHIRCIRAHELIQYTNMKFSEIADSSGFCCANDMSRKIREYYKKTPTQIRFEAKSLQTME